jgi:hypothetical protein
MDIPASAAAPSPAPANEPMPPSTPEEPAHTSPLPNGLPVPLAIEQIASKASSLSSLGSTPSRIISISESRPRGLFNDVVPENSTVWVEINPKPDFVPGDYEADDNEFNVVGIVGELGEGDDTHYEVQFEDDHIALVTPG